MDPLTSGRHAGDHFRKEDKKAQEGSLAGENREAKSVKIEGHPDIEKTQSVFSSFLGLMSRILPFSSLEQEDEVEIRERVEDAAIHPKFSRRRFNEMLGKLEKGELSDEEFIEMFEIAFNNKNLNKFYQIIKKNNPVFYCQYLRSVNEILKFSYYTQNVDKFRELTAKKDDLLARFENGETIADDEKVKPRDAYFMDNFLNLKFLNLLKNIIESSPEESISYEWREVLKLVENWKEFEKGIEIESPRSGDILFNTGNADQYYNSSKVRGKGHGLVTIATGEPIFHASIFIKRFDPVTGKFLPSRSHVTDKAKISDFHFGEFSHSEGFRFNLSNMLTEMGKIILNDLGIHEVELQELLQKETDKLHEETHEKFSREGWKIENGILPLMQVMLGESFTKERQESLESIPNRLMCCSEFATFMTLVLINRLEKLIQDKLSSSQEDTLFSSQFARYPAGYIKFFNNFLPTSRMILHPKNLYDHLLKKGLAIRVPPPKQIGAVFQVPKIKSSDDLGFSTKSYRHQYL